MYGLERERRLLHAYGRILQRASWRLLRLRNRGGRADRGLTGIFTKILLALGCTFLSVYGEHAIDRALYDAGAPIWLYPTPSYESLGSQVLLLLIVVLPAVFLMGDNLKRAAAVGLIASLVPIAIFFGAVLIIGRRIRLVDATQAIAYCLIVVTGAVLLAYGLGRLIDGAIEAQK